MAAGSDWFNCPLLHRLKVEVVSELTNCLTQLRSYPPPRHSPRANKGFLRIR